MNTDDINQAAPLPALCVYGPQHVKSIAEILVPALASQVLVHGCQLELHLVNYLDNRPLLKGMGLPNMPIRDWSSDRAGIHIGFGEGVNFLFTSSAPTDCFYLINPDSFPQPGCLDALYSCYAAQANVGIVEARQWPSEHPKEYNPETLETPWASGAFSLISADAYRRLGGFDPLFFLYNEDVDLSWRMWLAGYRILYQREAVAAHFTGFISYRADRYYYEHFFSSRNFVVLSYKFLGDAGETRALDYLLSTTYPRKFKDRVITSYQKIKPNVIRYSDPIDCTHIKILGFNQYHELIRL